MIDPNRPDARMAKAQDQGPELLCARYKRHSLARFSGLADGEIQFLYI